MTLLNSRSISDRTLHVNFPAMDSPLNVLSALFLTILTVSNVFSLEFQFERIELKNESYIPNRYNVSLLRITKLNRTTYAMNLEAEFFNDADTNHSMEVRFYYNRLNNNQYSRSPAHLPKQSICNIGNKQYKDILMPHLKGNSNFPQLKPGENFCPLKKVIF